MVNGKAKGSSFERTICKQLSLWLTGGSQEDCLWRSAMSGGRSTVAAKKGKRLAAQAGDISAVDAAGIALISKFFIECKAYKDLDFIGLLKNKGHLAEFWKIAVAEATAYKKQPMLIAKQNQRPVIVCLTDIGRRKFPSVHYHGPKISVPFLDLHIHLFDSFLLMAKPEDLDERFKRDFT